MTTENSDKLVNFERYCPLCSHKKKKQWQDPCSTCLSIPVRPETERPAYYKEREAK